MDLRSIPNIWLYVAALGLLVALGVYAWWRRSVPGARPFAIACLLFSPSLVGAVAETAAADLAAKIMWYKFQAVWLLPGVTAMTCFALEYVHPGRWLTRRNLILLSLFPLLALALILTNNLHHLVWLGFAEASAQPSQGIAGWIFFGYSLILVLVNIILFVGLFIRSPQHRWPAALIVLGQIASRALYALDMATPNSVVQPDPFILAAVIVFGMYAVSLFGFRILDPLPAARQSAIEQMRDGIVVMDTRRQVLSLNPAAESMLGTRTARARGKPLQEILPSLAGAGQSPGREDRLEISLATSGEPRRYVLDLSPLRDHRGLLVGHLLLLRDVTEQRRAQALVLERQWAQATLQEGEQLAHELHDGLSQNLAFLNVQAQAAQLFLQAEQREAAQASLARLAEVSRELQSDTRELIGNLLTISLPSEGFCSTLRRAVGRFEEQNGLHVSLEIEGNVDAVCGPTVLPPDAGVQLVRIVQEALANVRKHAGCPSQVGVRLTAEAGQMQLTITDNGAGFDPAGAASDSKHFGLEVMRQRAARIGAQMAVHSVPGQGTRVEVCVPLMTGGSGRDA